MTSPDDESSWVGRLAQRCASRHRMVAMAWIVGAVVVVAGASLSGVEFDDAVELPGSESLRAAELLADGGFPTRDGLDAQIVVAAESVAAPGESETVDELLASIDAEVTATARVITAAAAIMVVVFAGFVLSTDRALQLFGLGLATAIAVDATIVRLVLVPSTMELLGERNWWLPAPLRRALPPRRRPPVGTSGTVAPRSSLR